MSLLVVDASVALKWVIPEDGSILALALRREHRFTAPDLLIAECANADLTIETRQVQVDLRQVDVLRQADAASAAQQANKVEQSPHDVLVTIRGVVFGYSPPDKTRIGQGSDPDPSKRNYGIPTQMSESPQF